MGTLVFFFAVFMILAVAARYWGVDSTEAVNSCEWVYRKNWQRLQRDAAESC